MAAPTPTPVLVDAKVRLVARRGVALALVGDLDDDSRCSWAAAFVADQARFPGNPLAAVSPHAYPAYVSGGPEGVATETVLSVNGRAWSSDEHERLATVVNGRFFTIDGTIEVDKAMGVINFQWAGCDQPNTNARLLLDNRFLHVDSSFGSSCRQHLCRTSILTLLRSCPSRRRRDQYGIRLLRKCPRRQNLTCTAVLSKTSHANCCTTLTNRPLRPREGRFVRVV